MPDSPGLRPSGLPRIADCQHFPLVPVRFVPVKHAPAKLRVDLHIHAALHRAAILDAGRLDPRQYGIKLLLADAEAEMIDGEGLIRILKIQGQPVIHVNGCKCPGSLGRPRHAQQIRQSLADFTWLREGTMV